MRPIRALLWLLSRILIVGTAIAVKLLFLSALPQCKVHHLRLSAMASFFELLGSGSWWREGLIVAKRCGHFICYRLDGFVLLFAPTRTGKGTSVVIPNLLSYPGSVIAIDIKGENHGVTGRARATMPDRLCLVMTPRQVRYPVLGRKVRYWREACWRGGWDKWPSPRAASTTVGCLAGTRCPSNFHLHKAVLVFSRVTGEPSKPHAENDNSTIRRRPKNAVETRIGNDGCGNGLQQQVEIQQRNAATVGITSYVVFPRCRCNGSKTERGVASCSHRTYRACSRWLSCS